MFAGTTAMTFRSQLLLLYAARGVRGFGDGFAVIILPAYLSAIGFTPFQIGHRGDRRAARLGAADARGRLLRAAPRPAQPADARRRR